ncbi:uncharacterized protein LOC143213956 [Lasioglossum baleicum]|uniref:uncharacterized protein LOC143213956 n=1 Tax=Lasioglossum baleicum TaxID=434251 RepID=UPI003FCD8062
MRHAAARREKWDEHQRANQTVLSKFDYREARFTGRDKRDLDCLVVSALLARFQLSGSCSIFQLIQELLRKVFTGVLPSSSYILQTFHVKICRSSLFTILIV